MYFENARKRRSNIGITPPPEASPARMVPAPAGPRTPQRAPDAKPVKPQDCANRSRNQAKVSTIQVPFSIVFTSFQEQPRHSKFNYSSPSLGQSHETCLILSRLLKGTHPWRPAKGYEKGRIRH